MAAAPLPVQQLIFADGELVDWPQDGSSLTRYCYKTGGINPELVVVPPERRELNYNTVEFIARSFLTEGQLQPIGVKRMPGSPKYLLIWGANRVAAAKLLAQTAGRGPTLLSAFIYPAELPDWRCLMLEITENLARAELSNREKQVQTTLYAGLLKKHGLVADADALRSETQKRTENDGAPGREPKASAHVSVTQAVAKEQGIDADTVRYRIKQAADLAQAAGLEVPDPATPEALSAEMLMAIARVAGTAGVLKQNAAGRPPQPKEYADIDARFAAQEAQKSLFPFEQWEEIATGSSYNVSRDGNKWKVRLSGFDGMGIPLGTGYTERQAYGNAVGNTLRWLGRQFDKGQLFMNSDLLVSGLLELAAAAEKH